MTTPSRSIDPTTPILVGCGDVTDMTTPVEAGRSPFDLLAEAGRRALQDAGAAALAASIDTVAMLRLFSDTSHRFKSNIGTSTNSPKSVANRLGLSASRHIYTWNGGNMPQYLVNSFAEQIAAGAMRAAMIVGGEALRTQRGVQLGGFEVSWAEDPGGEPEQAGDPRRGWSDCEDRHNMRAAITMYPLIENAIRGQRGRSMETHLKAMAKLFARFADVAAANPYATRRKGYSAEALATIDGGNRWIGLPYPRLMVANAYIDQAAAVVMTSVGHARELGIPEHKWVFLHGCADGHDHWFLSDRTELGASPAIRAGAKRAFAMAGRTIEDVDFFDLYSCFPSAVEIACQEIGLSEDDPRGQTVTGGLPFFGGPGNSYVLNSISEMMRRVRGKPSSLGLVTANGNYITKHSFGLYSTEPTLGPWRREDPHVLQSELDRLPTVALTETPSGSARIETYTVMYGKSAPDYAVVMGRLDATGERFVANTPADPAVLADLAARDSLGRPGHVAHADGRNTFTPA
jgi:acetyl-CoA C-acetyltransferase